MSPGVDGARREGGGGDLIFFHALRRAFYNMFMVF